MFLKFILETGKDWPEGLPYALMAHNQSVHSSIGMTLYEALFSRIPERFFYYTGPISGLNMIDHMEKTFHTARSLMYQSQHRNEQSKKFQMAKQVYSEPGDIVMLNFGKTRDKKMKVYDKGLFIVVSRISPNTYRIHSLEDRKFHPIVHFDKLVLKKSAKPNSRMENLMRLANENASSDEEYNAPPKPTRQLSKVADRKFSSKMVHPPTEKESPRVSKLVAQMKLGKSIPV